MGGEGEICQNGVISAKLERAVCALEFALVLRFNGV
jgi:hypothetical protein